MSEENQPNQSQPPEEGGKQSSLTASQIVAVELDWASGKSPQEIEEHFRRLGYEVDLSDLPPEPYNRN